MDPLIPCDADDDSNDDQSSQAKFKALRKSKGTASLSCGGTSRIHKLDISFEDPCVSIEVPDEMCDADILLLRMYTTAIHAVISKPNKFTDGMACAISSEKHSFIDCKTLLDVEFLRKYFIAYCLQWKHTHRQIITAVNRLEASDIADIADTDDQDTVSDDSDTAMDDDNEQNFCEEGE